MPIFYYLVLIPLSYLPTFLREILSSILAFVLQHVVGYRARLVREQLELCYPNQDEQWYKKTVKAFYANLGDIILETIQGFSITPKQAIKRMRVSNPEVLDDLYEQGRSVIITGGHYVNWESMTLTGSSLKHKLYGLYKPLRSEFMDRKVRESREQYGTHMISIKDYKRHMINLETEPKAFIFAIDQSPRKGKGIWLDFLNRDSLVFTGPERLAKELDMTVVMGRMSRIRRGEYEVTFKLLTDSPRLMPEHEITRLTMADVEDQVNAAPADWLWSHKRWKHSREDDGQ